MSFDEQKFRLIQCPLLSASAPAPSPPPPLHLLWQRHCFGLLIKGLIVATRLWILIAKFEI